MTYSHLKIEKKWQKLWLQKKIFATNINDFQKPKFYILDMFPYPSGGGLHVGHLRGYLATDILTRMKRMQGFNVLHPVGFDSFGLPAEQYAILTKKDPRIFTDKNIIYFFQQLQNFGFAYDFDRVIKTHDFNYYRWTQWIFLQFLKHRLAFSAKTEVNYCPSLNTVLANEEIINIDGQMVSERGEHPVFHQQKQQWMLKITDYAENLLLGLKNLDWPMAIKKAQINWIGKKEGFTLQFAIDGVKDFKLQLPVFNLEYLPIVKFILLHVNNEIIDSFLSSAVKLKLEQFRKNYSQKVIPLNGVLDKKPAGLFAEFMVINPINGKKIPVFFAEYVSVNLPYGTKLGIAKVDVQDWFFAKKHQILNSVQLNLAKKSDFITSNNHFIQDKLKIKGELTKTVFYKLRDWVFARQRYWGEPFPVFYKENQVYPISETKLPLVLPSIPDIKMLFNQKSAPLASIPEWVKANYDVNTMPQWAGSCWYFLAYLLKKTDGSFWPLDSTEAKTILNHWMPVDIYVGGSEHAVSHLLYARFWNLFLVKIGCYDIKEPFQKLKNQGLILAASGKKMSKSKGNFIDPNTFLVSHGADAVRLTEKFLGPFEKTVFWNEKGLDAMRKWLSRVYRLFIDKKHLFQKKESSQLDYIYAQTVKNVSQNYEDFNFNVAISQLMVFVNLCYKSKYINWEYGIGFLKLLYPICPHLTEEIWFLWGQKLFLIESNWPIYNSKQLQKQTTVLAIQLNGKTKKIIKISLNLNKKQAVVLALQEIKVFLKQKKVQNIIFVQNKVVNFVF